MQTLSVALRSAELKLSCWLGPDELATNGPHRVRRSGETIIKTI
jgi:hypothetical protein